MNNEPDINSTAQPALWRELGEPLRDFCGRPASEGAARGYQVQNLTGRHKPLLVYDYLNTVQLLIKNDAHYDPVLRDSLLEHFGEFLSVIEMRLGEGNVSYAECEEAREILQNAPELFDRIADYHRAALERAKQSLAELPKGGEEFEIYLENRKRQMQEDPEMRETLEAASKERKHSLEKELNYVLTEQKDIKGAVKRAANVIPKDHEEELAIKNDAIKQEAARIAIIENIKGLYEENILPLVASPRRGL